jgi:dipeptidyl aminopeptidase/acylaminoacyl peptidase
MKSQKKEFKQKKPSKKLTYKPFLTCLLLLVVASAAGYVIYNFRQEHREIGQYNISDPFIGEDLFKSLDLKVVAKAHFPSNALRVYKKLSPLDGLNRHEFAYDVKDDHLTEYGLMLTPATKAPPKGFPVVILLHGYIDPERYKTDESYLAEMEVYAEHGFAVLKPDLRGQGLSLHSGQADSAYYSMAYNTDVMSLISAIKHTPNLDDTNINLWGHSMGSYLALRASVLSPDIKNVILLSSPVGSLREMYLTYIPPSDESNPYALAVRSEVFSKYGTPEENQRFWYDASPINFIGRIKARIQIHVGLDDQVVPPRFSADLDAALSDRHIIHQYYEYPDGGHSLEQQRPVIYERSLKLMQNQPKQAPVT